MKKLAQISYKLLSKWALLSILLISTKKTIVVGELSAVVNTTLGPVQGEIRTTFWNSIKYAAFIGIRYGKPPVGYLRFKPPVPADPWKETLNTTAETPHCMSIEFGVLQGTEDCLFLNVFTPLTYLEETPIKLRSVIVYIYGGAWIGGSSHIDLYGPDFLIERDVLVVTFDYRSGAFGFLSLNHPNATGNAGLKDQVLVLKWVQKNIKNFGGNPKNVTIMGASSGGMSVGYHIISDASVGLFHGAISMSGTPLMPWAFKTPEQAFVQAQLIGGMIGAKNTDKESLLKAYYDAPAELITLSTYSLIEIVSFAPTIENTSIATDVFLSTCSVKKYFSSNFTKVPMILGYMADETLMYASCKNGAMDIYHKLLNDTIDIFTYIGMEYPKIFSLFLSVSPFVDFEHMSTTESGVLKATVADSTAILFVVPIDLTQRILTTYNADKPLYYYRITFTTENGLHSVLSKCAINAAAHSDDVAYLFYSPQTNYTHNPENRLTRTIYRITTMWTNFAKYGDPTPEWVDEYPLNITWPISGPKGHSLNIADELVVEPRPVSNFVKEIEMHYSVHLWKMGTCD